MEIRKPMSVARAEFINSFTNLINTSGLPMFVIEPILRDMFNDVHALAQKQLENDIRQYEEFMASQIDNSENTEVFVGAETTEEDN